MTKGSRNRAKPLCRWGNPSEPGMTCLLDRGHDGPHMNEPKGAYTWR